MSRVRNVILRTLFLLAMSRWTYGAEIVCLYEIKGQTKLAPIADEVEKATLESETNENTVFRLTLTGSHPFSLPKDKIGLVVGDELFPFETSNSSTNQYDITTIVSGSNAIPQIEAKYKPVMKLRRHPGYVLRAVLAPEKDKIKAGQPVNFTMTITNVGTTNFSFMGDGIFNPNQSCFELIAFDLNRNKVIPNIQKMSSIVANYIPQFVTLTPGESYSFSTRLSDWFSLKRSGRVLVAGTCHIGLYDNTTREFIWDDYVGGDFIIEVE